MVDTPLSWARTASAGSRARPRGRTFTGGPPRLANVCACGFVCTTEGMWDHHIQRCPAQASATALDSPGSSTSSTPGRKLKSPLGLMQEDLSIDEDRPSKFPLRRSPVARHTIGGMLFGPTSSWSPMTLRPKSESTPTSPPPRSPDATSLAWSNGSGSATLRSWDLSPLSPPRSSRDRDPASVFVGAEGQEVRLLLVRHAQSGNKAKEPSSAPSSDPDLSEKGFQQADLLCQRLEKELLDLHESGRLLVASSPMRRCLETILPLVQQLQLPRDVCIAHGSCYEYRCAGTAFRGSHRSMLTQDFPEFRPEGFGRDGFWDYTGTNEREIEEEARERALGVVDWIDRVLVERLRAQDPDGEDKTIVLCTHQTFADLICRIIMDGTAEEWSFGDIKYKLQNTGITEIILSSDGSPRFGCRNSALHLL